MTSFARQVRRRMAKTPEGRIRLLAQTASNFDLVADTPGSQKPKSSLPGHLAKVSPRKKRRRVVQAARRANRG